MLGLSSAECVVAEVKTQHLHSYLRNWKLLLVLQNVLGRVYGRRDDLRISGQHSIKVSNAAGSESVRMKLKQMYKLER